MPQCDIHSIDVNVVKQSRQSSSPHIIPAQGYITVQLICSRYAYGATIYRPVFLKLGRR